MADLNDFIYTDDVHDVLAIYVNRLLASTPRSEYKNVETLAADRELTDADTPIQRFECDGADRVVSMPAEDAVGNHLFVVINASAAADTITVKNNAAAITLNALAQGEMCLMLPMGDGTYKVLISDAPADGTQYARKDHIWEAVGGGGAVPHAPGGRLTLASATPVTTTDQLAKGTIYHTPGPAGDLMPRWNGAAFVEDTLAELSMTLNATPHPANTMHDIFCFDDGGTNRIGSVQWRNSGQAITGATNANPCVITANSHGVQNGDVVDLVLVFASAVYVGQYAASSVAANTITFTGINSTSDGAFVGGSISCRGVGAGTSELEMLNGILVNKYDITAFYSASSVAVTARYGTFVGTFRITETNAQTESSKANRLLWNYYNPEWLELYQYDATDNWTRTTAAWETWHNTDANRVTFVVGLPRHVEGSFFAIYSHSSAGSQMGGGIGLDVNNTNTSISNDVKQVPVSNYKAGTTSIWQGYLQGYHYLQMMQFSVGSTSQFFGNGGDPIRWKSALSGGLFG